MEKKINKVDARVKIREAKQMATYLDHGRVPPQAVDLEEAVLGIIMLEKGALVSVLEILYPEVFYKEAHRIIFQAITDLFNDSNPVDILTVVNQLRTSGELDLIGGAYYISQLTNKSTTSASAEYNSRIILQKFVQRELIRVSGETIKDAYEDTIDVFALLDRAGMEILKVNKIGEKKKSDLLNEVGIKTLTRIKKIRRDESGGWGIKTGITNLDNITRGFQQPDLIIIASRPGMGKTALMMTIAKKVGITDEIPMAVFSLEMSSEQLVQRLFVQETGISYSNLSGGKFTDADEERLDEFVKTLPKSFIIDDTPALTLTELRAKCIRMVMEQDVKIIFIDYLQLMSGSNEKGVNREQQISEISRGCKQIAKELEIPVVALSQLSRSVESRGGDHRPKLADLRESGAIEQDADIVMFIYRASYYFEETALEDKGMAVDDSELLVEKHRNGDTGAVQMRFIADVMKFEDYYPESDIDSGVKVNDYTEVENQELPF